MNVVLITGEYPPLAGGVADYTALLAAGLAAQDQTVTVLTSRGGASADGGTVSVRREVPVWNWHIHEYVSGVVDGIRPDVIHIQYEPAAYDLHPAITLLPERLLKAGVDVPVVTTFHDLRPPHAFRGSRFIDHSYVKRLARGSALAICSEEIDATTLDPWRPTGQTVVIPIGSNIPRVETTDDERAALRREAGVPEDGFLVGFFGFANQTKGIDTIIRGFTRFVSTHQDARLVFIGEAFGTADKTNLKTYDAITAAIEVFGLSNAVVKTGALPADGVSRWLQTVDAIALPFDDGWSWRRGSLLAALTNGAPVITTTGSADRTSQGALPRLVHGRDALLIPPGDAEALHDSLRQLLSAPGLRYGLSRGGQAIAGEFSWERIARDHVAAYSAIAR